MHPQELKNLNPGHLPKDVFYAITRLVVTPTVVIIPVCNGKVGLLRRPKNDFDFPNMWHTPGGVLLATDKTIFDAQKRICKRECDYDLKQELQLVDVVFDQIPRGKEISLIYRLVFESEIESVTWFAIDDLPDDIVASDIPRVKLTTS